MTYVTLRARGVLIVFGFAVHANPTPSRGSTRFGKPCPSCKAAAVRSALGFHLHARLLCRGNLGRHVWQTSIYMQILRVML